MTEQHTPAPALSPTEYDKVQTFGLDLPEAYDLSEDGDIWMVEGTLDPDVAEKAVRALWVEQGVQEMYDDLDPKAEPFRFEPSDSWWWEPVDPARPDDEAYLRGASHPRPDGVQPFTGVRVTL